MDQKEQEVFSAVMGLGAKHADEIAEALQTITKNIVEKGAKPAQALNISRQKMEGLYAQAYQLYNSGNYAKALRIFQMLTVLDGDSSRYLMGQGACYHMQKDYVSAIHQYLLVSMGEKEDPMSLYYAAACCQEMGDLYGALTFLQMSLDRIKGRAEYQEIKARAEVMLAQLKQEAVKVNAPADKK